MQKFSYRVSDAEIRSPEDPTQFSWAELREMDTSDHGKGLSPGTEEVLLRIPGSIVHLIDGQESEQIAEGVFSLIRLSRDGKAVAVLASVGEHLQWPITKDEPTNKMDKYHYLFTLKVPQNLEEGDGEDPDGEDDPKMLNYGVTFRRGGSDKSLLNELDDYLRRYTTFKVSNNAQDERLCPAADRAQTKKGRLDALGEFIFGEPMPSPTAKSSPFDVSSSLSNPKSGEERSSAYWTAMAPNVEVYSSSVAKGISNHSSTVIGGLHWCSNATIDQLQRGGDYVKGRVKAKDTPTQIGPSTMKNIRRVKKVSKMTDRVAKGVLAGIVTATGVVSNSLIRSRGGKEIFKMVPGEVALASLEAFGKVFDAVELAGKGVLSTTRVVTSDVVTHRYGEEAGEGSRESMAALGHLLSTAWTVTKARKALQPKNGVISKRALLKTALASASGQSSSRPS